MARMVRKQVYLYEDQHKALQAASQKGNLSEAELIRRGLGEILGKSGTGAAPGYARKAAGDGLHLIQRPRRLRASSGIRKLVRETRVSPENLVMPYFVVPGKNVRQPIVSMPGQSRLSVDLLVKEAAKLFGYGVPAVLLFGIPSKKDSKATQAYVRDGIVQQAVSALKEKVPELVVITDVCLCEYMDHGHCGVVQKKSKQDWTIDNDASVELIARTALSHAEAGADIVAPSDMMDGRVGAIRRTLDAEGYSQTGILAYAAKYASAFYGPFREAAESTPAFGDRRSYQMDPANRLEALREVALDIEEGADIVMVKPALAYMDIIRDVKENFGVPVAAYNVSGEYAMVKSAAANGQIDENAAVSEVLTGLKRAGADIIVTYFAQVAAQRLTP